MEPDAVTASSRQPGRIESVFERVLRMRKESDQEDIAKLERQLRRRDFVPSKDERPLLFSVAGEVSLVEVMRDVFSDEYTTWLDQDAGDREYGGPKIEESED